MNEEHNKAKFCIICGAALATHPFHGSKCWFAAKMAVKAWEDFCKKEGLVVQKKLEIS